jgi:hypothetical protein
MVSGSLLLYAADQRSTAAFASSAGPATATAGDINIRAMKTTRAIFAIFFSLSNRLRINRMSLGYLEIFIVVPPEYLVSAQHFKVWRAGPGADVRVGSKCEILALSLCFLLFPPKETSLAPTRPPIERLSPPSPDRPSTPSPASPASGSTCRCPEWRRRMRSSPPRSPPWCRPRRCP